MVIGTGLVDEAYRPLIDGNHARFCAIGYQMGEALLAAVGPGQHRYRRPEKVGGPIGSLASVKRRRETQRGAIVGRRRHGEMLAGVRPIARRQRARGEAACGQHHPAAGVQRLSLPLILNLHPADRALRFAQRQNIDIQPQVHAFTQRRSRHAGNQRIAHRQAGTARVLHPVAGVAQQQPGAMGQGAQRAAHVEKMLNIDAVDHHPAKQQHPRRR